MRFAVLEFPGSNCDHDCMHALGTVMRQKAELVWHERDRLPAGTDCVVVPGGFSYGDYLRCGAVARFSPVMKAVFEHARRGGLVWGICNGFQILAESHLVPGVLLRNKHLRFLCQDVYVRVERRDSAFTSAAREGQVLRLPIAHGEGNYFCEPDTLKRLQDHRQIVLRYCDAGGEASEESNPNGALENIAGVLNAQGNVLGMMPHPERVSEAILGGTDGRVLFESALQALTTR
ncbi:MAG TPA: phosphoribosylformylglycinamidine synthase subunit PurQ [bacterium]|jgi:phosphoribosylformylglycinamidine synthase I|nr:phosphoribosylformylglycinamidine synthase subunit PurQ [bacterium]